MRARDIFLLVIVLLAIGTAAQNASTEVLSSPNDDVLSDIDSWPITGYTCDQLAQFRLRRDQEKCLDLSEVVLTAEFGAEDNYRNSCLADLVKTQMLLSMKCQFNVEYSPVFYSFDFTKGLAEDQVISSTNEIQNHCNKMGENIRWFTACGPGDHFNSCIKTYSWFFLKYLTRTLKRFVQVPYVTLPSTCPSSDENPTDDPVKDPNDTTEIDDPSNPPEDPTPVEDPTDPISDPEDPSTKLKKCVARAEEILLKRETKCLGKQAKLKLNVCAWNKRKQNCRLRTDKLAKKLSKVCGIRVGLVRTAEEIPTECEVCKGKEFIEKERECAGNHRDTKTELCVWYKKRDACRKTTDAALEKLRKTCGYPVRIPRTKDVAPQECSFCSEKFSKYLQDLLSTAAPAVCSSSCDKWRYKNKLRDQVQEEVKRFRGICGEISRFVKPGILLTEKAPSKCQLEKTEDCVTRAKEQIKKSLNECTKKTESLTDECRSFEARMLCFGEAKNQSQQWKKFCGIKINPEYPPTTPPAKCIEGNQGVGLSSSVSLPNIITAAQPAQTPVDDSSHTVNVTIQNTPTTCVDNASSAIDKEMKSCVGQLETMKFGDMCGITNFKNMCLIRGLHSQLRWFKECNYTIPKFEMKPEHKFGCHPEGCLEKARELMSFIGIKCKEQVQNSRMNECAKAQTVNKCLSSFEWVPKFFNNTCLEKILLFLPQENETSVCGNK